MHYLLLPGRKFKLLPFARMTFTGSMNYKPLTLKDLKNTKKHKRTVWQKEFEDVSKSGLQIKQKLMNSISLNILL